jgi:hypothetical protein
MLDYASGLGICVEISVIIETCVLFLLVEGKLPPVLVSGGWLSPPLSWLIEVYLYCVTLIHWCYYLLILTSICLSVKAALKFPMTPIK